MKAMCVVTEWDQVLLLTVTLAQILCCCPRPTPAQAGQGQTWAPWPRTPLGGGQSEPQVQGFQGPLTLSPGHTVWQEGPG